MSWATKGTIVQNLLFDISVELARLTKEKLIEIGL